MIRNLPNLLTGMRIAVTPIFVILMTDPSHFMRWVALVLFLLAALTDFADGSLARRFQVVSDTGKLLDPLADKILVTAALVMLVAQRSEIDGLPWVPGWMVVVILSREVWVTGLRSLAASRGVIVPAGSAGKVKTVLQMAGIVCILSQLDHIPFFGRGASAHVVGLNLLLLSILFSYWSAIDYTYRVFSTSPSPAPRTSVSLEDPFAASLTPTASLEVPPSDTSIH